MNCWIDAELPPALADWLSKEFDITAVALRDIGLRDAQDLEIFVAAQFQNVIVITKDSVFVDLAMRLGAPLQIL